MNKDEYLNLLSEIKVAKIVDFKKNENSDKLFVVKILTNEGETQVVTGADNFKIGDYVPFLGIGKVVPGFLLLNQEKIVLEKRTLRGYESNGMLLAKDEIGIGEDHSGLFIISDRIKNELEDSFIDLIVDEIDQLVHTKKII